MGTHFIKVPAGTAPLPTVKTIKFFFKTDDIFNEASEITSFKASSIKKDDGLADFNRVAISEDERIHLKKHTKKRSVGDFQRHVQNSGPNKHFAFLRFRCCRRWVNFQSLRSKYCGQRKPVQGN